MTLLLRAPAAGAAATSRPLLLLSAPAAAPRHGCRHRCRQQQPMMLRLPRATGNNNNNNSDANAAAAGPSSSPKQQQAAAGASASPGAAAAQLPPQQADSPFLDPLVRSLFLGIGAGMLCEACHVLWKALGLVETGGLLAHSRVDLLAQLGPNYVTDHAVAIGAWVLLYAVEAAAVASLLTRNTTQHSSSSGKTTGPATPTPSSSGASLEADTASLAAATLRLEALPTRKMFPPALTRVKDAVAASLAAVAAASPAVATSSTTTSRQQQQALSGWPLALTAAPPGLSKELEKTLDDIEAAAAAGPDANRQPGSSSGSGATVTEPPVKKQDQEEQADKEQQQQQQRPQQVSGPIKTGEHLRRRQPGTLVDDQPGSSSTSSRRDRELAERASYLKNFWYAAALSSKVTPDKPLGVDILGGRISLFRDESGDVVAIDDTCPHRGAPLSGGWTSTDAATGKKCLVCPYHGWAFDADGRLRDVPSAEAGAWPKRPLVSSYAVQERGGFVWLFYGSKEMPADERPPIPFTPELEDPAWRAVYGEIEFESGHWGVFENAIDMAHIHYLHGDSFGNSDKPKVMDMASTRDTFETTCTFRIHNKPVNRLWEWTSVPSVPVTAKAMLPSTSAVTIELAHGVRMITFVNTVPISASRSINRFCLIRNFALSPAFDFMARDNMYKILGEDKVMVDRLAPERLEVEYSLAPDLPQIAFRQLRQEWVDLGYAVPPESVLLRRGGLLPRGH